MYFSFKGTSFCLAKLYLIKTAFEIPVDQNRDDFSQFSGNQNPVSSEFSPETTIVKFVNENMQEFEKKLKTVQI